MDSTALALTSRQLDGNARLRLCWGMPKRSSKVDVKKMAFQILAEATIEGPDRAVVSAAAATLGRLGGKKGGPARARALGAKRRREIASIAAQATCATTA